MTRKRAGTNTSGEKKRKLSEKEQKTESISLIQKYIQGQIKNNIDSLLQSVTRIQKLKEIEVNTMKEKVDSLERANDEKDKENSKLKQDLSRAKSCGDCKTKGEEIKTLTKCIENLKQDNEKENQKLREHIFTRKIKMKNYISILKERDDKIENLEIDLEELKQKMEEAENTKETEDRLETTNSTETTEKKGDSLEKKEQDVKSKPTGKSGQNIIHLIDTTLQSINSDKESSEMEEEKQKKKSKVKTIIVSSASNSAQPAVPSGKKNKKTNKRNRS